MYRRPLSVGSCQEKKPGLRGLRKLIAILIRLRGGTGAVPSLILGRHSLRLGEPTARRAVVPPISLPAAGLADENDAPPFSTTSSKT